MSEKSPLSLTNAITTGLSEVTLARTLALYEKNRGSDNNRALTFRGDVAERFGYEKVAPLMTPAITQGNMVIIEGVSQKTGQTAHYQVLVNQWNLLELLARLD